MVLVTAVEGAFRDPTILSPKAKIVKGLPQEFIVFIYATPHYTKMLERSTPRVKNIQEVELGCFKSTDLLAKGID
jgi:hypothetical protein